MEDPNKKIDYAKLPEDLKAKLLEIDKQSPANQQLEVLQDIASMTHALITIFDSKEQTEGDRTQQFGSLLMDMRESLKSLNSKENPETPDFARPVVAGLDKLENALTQALKGVDVKPIINVEKQDTPQVHVSSPAVNTSGIERILKSELPKAFKQAIQQIPATEKDDYTPITTVLEDIASRLESLETVTRMKPTAPKVVGVTNPDGSLISGGSGGGGAVTIADGADVTEGTTTDAGYTSGAGTVVGILKGIFTKVSGTLATSRTWTLSSGTDSVTAVPSGTQDENLKQVNGVTVNVGIGTASTGTQRVAVSSDSFPTTQAVTGTFFQTTQPISATSLPLPTGAATSANQTTGNTSLSSIDTKLSGTLATSLATVPQADLPTTPSVNQKTVTTAGTAVQLQTNTLKVGVIVQALSTNTGSIFVGGSSVSASTGFELQAGQATSLGVSNTNVVWIDAATNGDKVCWIAS